MIQTFAIFGATIFCGIMIVLLFRILSDLTLHGSRRVHELREAGFDLRAWAFGEAKQGRQRRLSSVKMRDGMHVRVKGRKYSFKRKSAPTPDMF